MFLFAFITFCLGAILGSFINALSFRWGTGVSVVNGRSRCMHCGHTLSAFDLVPIFSWIALRGRCQYCGARISWQYPLVELTGALLSLGAYFVNSDPLSYVLLLLVLMTTLFIAVYDVRHKIIPLSASLWLMALVAADRFFAGGVFFALIDGLLLAAPLLLISFFSGGRWMGWGDGILEISLGWLLGLTVGLTAFMFAFWSGACVGIALLYLRRGVTMRSEVPFAPFLIFGAWAALLFHVDLFQALPALLP
jgi:prepilin signal peptidase PulO-like enzyme (type II secretory pathway)